MTRQDGHAQAGDDWDRRGLPAWTYHNEALARLEMSELFHTHWQIAGHVNDLPNSGDYLTFDVGSERAVIVRGPDGAIRTFHNLCRHRGSRVAVGDRGSCKNALVCPFHGWVYNLDGTLRGAARPNSYPPLDKAEFGLRHVEMEVWHGLIFIRFRPGSQPSVRELLQPFDAEVSQYRAEEMIPSVPGKIWSSDIAVNWKSVRDVDNEGYHVAMAHPALQDLYGSTYRETHMAGGINVSRGRFQPHAGRRWSVRNYMKVAGGPSWLRADLRDVWTYYGLFPNNVIIATPETIQFYQELPVSVDRARIRSISYRRPAEDRRQRLARYLTYRIDRETYAEDTQLSIWSNESMKSSAFEGFYLSDLERLVRAHHDRLRNVLPVVTLDQPPPDSEMAGINAVMKLERDGAAKVH